MKKSILVILLMIVGQLFIGCKKQASKQPAKEEMTVAQLKIKYGIDLIGIYDYQFGSAAIRSSGRGRPKADAVVVVWFNDLLISGSVSCTTSPDAEWGGIQKFLAEPLSNDGAVSYCNFNWSYTTPPASMDCPTTTSGVYRGWTSDKVTYDIHISGNLAIQ